MDIIEGNFPQADWTIEEIYYMMIIIQQKKRGRLE